MAERTLLTSVVVAYVEVVKEIVEGQVSKNR